MDQFIVDEVIRHKLSQFSDPVELCDSAGLVLGRFVPAVDPSQYAPVTPQVNREELDRRKNSSEWYTTAEVLSHLESL